jgi:hypothetical protein
MKRRPYLWTFLFTLATGWAAAHFTVGSAGSVALRAVVSEGRMAFSSSEKESAAARTASLTGKSLAEQAGIIAGWWDLTSVAEIRHLYAALDKLPPQFRDAAREILLGRWAMLDPDSLILAAAREGDNNVRLHFVTALLRHWAAGRSPEEVADKIAAVAGDARKFIPEPPPGGYYRPGEALAQGNAMLERFAFDPRAALEVLDRLKFKMPAEGYSAVFSALAKLDPAEAQRRLAAITDPALRRAAEMGIASQMAERDPEAALALCAKGGKEAVAAIAPGYFKHLLSLPNAEAWKKAGEFMDRFNADGRGNHMFLQTMAQRDPAGFFQWMGERPSAQRGMGEMIMGSASGPELREAMQGYLSTAGYRGMYTVLLTGTMVGGNAEEVKATTRWLADNATPDRQVYAGASLLGMLRQFNGATDTADTRTMIQMMHAAELSPETSALLLNKDDVGRTTEGIAASVSRNWPESAALLDGLSPSAVQTALPGFIRGAAAQEPERAATFLAAQPDSPAAIQSAETLAKEWSRFDLEAAQQWAATLTGDRRTNAEKALADAAKDWQR